MKRQRRLRTRTRTAPRSRARSAEPCTFIMETARRGNAACTINVGFLVSASTATSHSRPEQARSRWCSVVVYKVVRIVGVRPAAEGAAGTVGSDGRAGGSAVPVATSVAGVAGRARGSAGPGVRAQPRRRRAAGLSRVARGGVWRRPASRTGSSIPAFTRSRGAYTQKPVVWTHLPRTCRASRAYTPHPGVRIRRTLGCVYAPTRVNAPTTAYKHICVNAASGA